MSEPVLAVCDLEVDIATGRGLAHPVRSVSWELYPGEILALVGESGSGKSVTVKTIMGILEKPNAKVTAGQVRLDGEDLLQMSPKRHRRLCGDVISMVPQDALAALNPVVTVGRQLVEAVRTHQSVSRADAKEVALDLMQQVGIPDPARRFDRYPHEFSGGMCQRILIAMAIANSPTILVGDEPTTALDVTVQARVMKLLVEQRAARGLSVVLVTHDLALVAEVADRVIVMYGGRIMEDAPLGELLARPAHPYTQELMLSTPDVDGDGRALTAIKGSPPSALKPPSGCPFHPRCPMAAERCRTETPAIREVADGHRSACHFAEDLHAKP